jgi:hypothetical protein
MINYQGDDLLKQRVWKIMQSHVGYENKIGRHNLVLHACGNYTRTNYRKVRDALSELPVISTSTGGGGYWLPASDDEINRWEDEMLSRTKQIYKRIFLARTWLKQNRQPERAVQPQLLEVR